MTDILTGQQESETKVETVVPVVAAPPAAKSTEVRDPDRLLELYRERGEELKTLREYKATQDAAVAKANADRLAAQGQYEALVPIKIEEALAPVNQSLAAEKARADKVAADLEKAKAEYAALKSEIQTNTLKDAVYSAFVNPKVGGDPATSRDALWKLYGSDVKLDTTGKPIELENLFTELKADPFGAKLFLAVTPEGSGTPPQGGVTRPSGKAAPKEVTAAEFNRRGSGYTTEQVIAGEVVIKG